MEDPVSNNCEQVPTNRALAWFRVLLWILPAGFVVTSAIGLGWVHEKLVPYDSVIVLWFLLNIAFLIGTGWFVTQISSRPQPKPNGVIHEIFAFVVYQFLLIPTLLGLVLFCVYLIEPFYF